MAIPFRTQSGRWLDLERPSVCDIDVRDIASGLSKACRFAGHIDQFYSVAHHALFVTEIVPDRLKFRALNHDNTEAYLGDLSRHLKHSEYLQGYRILEARLESVIDEAVGLWSATPEESQSIKDADLLAVVYEHTVLRLHVPFSISMIVEAISTGFIPACDIGRLAVLSTRLDQVSDYILPSPDNRPSIESVEALFKGTWGELKVLQP